MVKEGEGEEEEEQSLREKLLLLGKIQLQRRKQVRGLMCGVEMLQKQSIKPLEAIQRKILAQSRTGEVLRQEEEADKAVMGNQEEGKVLTEMELRLKLRQGGLK